MPRQIQALRSSTPESPDSTASTASILSDGEIVPARKRPDLSSTTSTPSTASLDPDEDCVFPTPTVSDDLEKSFPLGIAMAKAPPTALESEIQQAPLSPTRRFRSPYSRHHGFQLDESPEQFLQRLPPSTTTLEQVGEWIWMHNPYFDPSTLRQSDVKSFIIQGDALLRSFDTYKEEIAMSSEKPKAKQAMIKKQREDLPSALKNAAREHGVTHGKWMLFPSEKDVDQVWLKVVQGTCEGKFGTGAKVAPAGSSGGRERLICVYTKDYSDIADVERVLLEMEKHDLVSKVERPIYYKADAWTHLGIDAKNNYGLRASLYSSRDILQTSNMMD